MLPPMIRYLVVLLLLLTAIVLFGLAVLPDLIVGDASSGR